MSRQEFRTLRKGTPVGALCLAILMFSLSGCGGGDERQEAELPPAEEISAAADEAAGIASGAAPDTVLQEAGFQVDRPETAAAEAVVPTGSVSPEPDAPRPRSSDPVDSPVAVGGGTGAYSLQLGSFQKAEYAEARAAELRDLGIAAQIEEALVEGTDYHRVVVSGLASMDAAEQLGERIRRELGFEYLVRKD